MSTDYPALGMLETIQILESGNAKALDDVHDLEAALELIRKGDERVEEYKVIKRKRAAVIDNEIEKIESRNEFLRSVIAKTLKQAKTKSVTFPGVGKVSARDKKGAWVVKDESELIKVLKDEGEYGQIVEIEEIIKKKDLNSLLDVWEKVGKLPSSVVREPNQDAVTIKFDKTADDLYDAPVPIKSSMVTVDGE